ncbi:hypothetical protein [Neorhizobium sp. DT-125]|uniref:hypothetical protein n=1 Tax=Neorhizobium sp. DT-125 TaxID=3396163 RepID=UPI003F1AD36F
MIRFEKKAVPQPLPKTVEDKLFDEIPEAAAEEHKKPAKDSTRRRPQSATGEDRLI